MSNPAGALKKHIAGSVGFDLIFERVIKRLCRSLINVTIGFGIGTVIVDQQGRSFFFE